MALDSHLYRDPMLIVQERQERQIRRSCQGCIHERSVDNPFGGDELMCGLGRRHGKRCRRYKKEEGLTKDQIDEIESVLGIWYSWDRSYKVAKGYPKVSPYARDTPPQRGNVYDDSDSVEERLHANIGEQVSACLDSLPSWRHRVAVGLTTANKGGLRVLRSETMSDHDVDRYYRESLELLWPMLRRRELVRS